MFIHCINLFPLVYFFLAVEDINREDFTGKQKLFENETL